MSEIVEFSPDVARAQQQRRNRQIGSWLTKLSSYLTHSVEFREMDERGRAVFWAELVEVMAEADLPDAAWTSDSIRFCRRQFKFFPCAAELCRALERHVEPVLAAQKQRWEQEKISHSRPRGDGSIPLDERLWLDRFREAVADGFRSLGEERGTNPDEARHSALTLMRQQAPAAYATLNESERRDDYGRKYA